MSRRTTTLFAGAAFALFGALGAAAYAQPAPPPGERHEVQVIRSGDGSEVRIERDGARTMIMRTEQHRQEMTAHLRAILQLKPSQEAALGTYVQALQPQAETMVRIDKRETPQTTPERLAEMEKMMAEHEAAMRARIEATRTFYGQLDPAQKKAFDELDLSDGHMGMGLARMIRINGPMPPMPPMPPMMHPTPPAPPAPPPTPGE